MTPTIDAQRWNQVRAAFDELIELDDVSRSERLAAIGASDPGLRAAVEELLASDAEAEIRLAHVEIALVAPISQDDQDEAVDPLHLVGRTVSHFRVNELLGAGGMGVVYRAEDTQLRRTVALKFPLPGQLLGRKAKARFVHEARSAAALDHPHICSVFEAGETADGQLFLAMPLYEGETLKSRINRGFLPVADSIKIAWQISQGLSAAHKAGIVHRDIKPANVMLLADGSVKILDFGLAKVTDSSLTASHFRVGTASYMAPEQIRGTAVDGRTDLWALGVMLYEMVTGRCPFRGEQDVAIAHSIMHDEPERPTHIRTEIDPGLEEIILTLLHKDSSQRIATADELASHLDALEHGVPYAAALSLPRAAQSARRRRMARIRVAAIATIVAVLAFGAWRLWPESSAGSTAQRSIAVLPFENKTGDESNHYIVASLGDEIANELASVASVRAASRAGIFGLSATGIPDRQIGRELGVSSILHGNVERAGNRLRVSMRLVSARTQRQEWTKQYTVSFAGLTGVQREAARAVVEALDAKLTDDENARLGQPPTASARAYEFYLRGREVELRDRPSLISPRSEENLRLAQSFYWRARELDPQFALARARLAFTHALLAYRLDESEARREQARIEAETALRLQPDLADAHVALGFYWLARHDDAKAIASFRRAFAEASNQSEWHTEIGMIYRRQGRWEEAVAEFERAMQRDPRDARPASQAAMSYSRMRRYQDAVRAWDRVLSIQPDYYRGWIIKGQVFIRWQGNADTLAAVARRIPAEWDEIGAHTRAHFAAAMVQRRYRDALAAVNASRVESGGDGLIYRTNDLMRAQIYDALGKYALARNDYEEARRMLEDSVAAHPRDASMRVALGLAYAGLQRKQDAAREARRAMELVPMSQTSMSATAFVGGAAEIFARSGDIDEALKLLELLLAMPAGREVSVALLRVDPTWDPLRKDPRFDRLLQRFSTT